MHEFIGKRLLSYISLIWFFLFPVVDLVLLSATNVRCFSSTQKINKVSAWVSAAGELFQHFLTSLPPRGPGLNSRLENSFVNILELWPTGVCLSLSAVIFTIRMATNKDDADIEDIFANEEELERALCVLAGSDPENCSYFRVRIAPCTVSPPCSLYIYPATLSCRVAFFEIQVQAVLDARP